MALQGMIDDYSTFMNELESAIQSALYGSVRDGLIESIGRSAEENVYSYDAAPHFMAKRRGEIGGRENMLTDVYGTTLVLKNKTVLQNGEPNEVDIVESGNPAWHQPGPRPFMEEGLQNYVGSGKAEADLYQELFARGFSFIF